YWQAISKSKVSAGGFLWSLNDESLARIDKGGKLDSNGNQAPDGITGPYREKEGSFYAIKEIWSPVVLKDQQWPANGRIAVENRYAFTDLKQCSFTWEQRQFSFPTQPDEPGVANVHYGVGEKGEALAESILPG